MATTGTDVRFRSLADIAAFWAAYPKHIGKLAAE
jgi:hypothetical protein